MKVTVIGSSGSMGSFFVRYFVSRGVQVVGSDFRKKRFPGMVFNPSNLLAVSGADVVLVATPMESILSVCRALAPNLKEGSVLVEVSSIKNDLPRRIGTLAGKRGAHLLSIHPLFGPSLVDYSGMKVCVIGGKNTAPTRLARKIFPEARLFPMSSEEHDRLMGLMLSLTHLVNLAYARVVSGNLKPSSFRAMATPSAFLQSLLAEAVLSQDPALVSRILFTNRFAAGHLKAYLEELSKLQQMLSSGEEAGFRDEHRSLAGAFSSSSHSMNKVYRAGAAVKSLG